MVKKAQHVDIEIDKLTNSIENAFSGDSFDTELIPIKKENLRPIKKEMAGSLIGNMSSSNLIDLYTNWQLKVILM